MKVLVTGLGSAGQRHVRNLRALYGRDVDILAYRVRALPHVLTDAATMAAGATVEQTYGIRSFSRLADALAEQPAVAIVSNPTTCHLPTALAAARAGCHLLIEKPLADTMEGIDELTALVERQGLVATVGYQLRFHPALVRARALLGQGAIGELQSVHAEFTEYLPDAHPYEDYRQSYAARADLGGGVILCYIHEFDYLTWWLGLPRQVSTTGGRLGDLEIDVEDTATTTMAYRLGTRDVAVEVHQSFLGRPGSRTCRLSGDAGVIDMDLNAPSVTLTRDDGATDRQGFDGFNRNQMFVDELSHFITAVAGGHAPMVPLREAAASLRVALAARESLRSGQAVALS